MPLIETIGRWLGRKPSVDKLPFEELPTRYVDDPEGVYEEFVRRLHRIVFQAAKDFLARNEPASADKEGVELKVMEAFRDFAPQFAIGDPSLLLVQFEGAVRRVLDDEAFQGIAHRYYYQLPIYHLKDEEQRKYLAASYEKGIRSTVAEEIAEQFRVSIEHASKVIAEGNRSIEDLIANDFTEEELKDMTQGYVSKNPC